MQPKTDFMAVSAENIIELETSTVKIKAVNIRSIIKRVGFDCDDFANRFAFA